MFTLRARSWHDAAAHFAVLQRLPSGVYICRCDPGVIEFAELLQCEASNAASRYHWLSFVYGHQLHYGYSSMYLQQCLSEITTILVVVQAERREQCMSLQNPVSDSTYHLWRSFYLLVSRRHTINIMNFFIWGRRSLYIGLLQNAPLGP